MMIEKTIANMTAAELKKILAEKETEEKAAREALIREYEAARSKEVHDLVGKAKTLAAGLSDFKKTVHEAMDRQAEKLADYGKIRTNSKGGFSITDADDSLRIIRRRDTEPVWDERANKAIELIKDFLGSAIKRRDTKMYEILIGFLAKNENGDLEYAKVFGLLEHEDKFGDPRWVEGLRLLKESYSVSLKCFGYEFKIKDAQSGKWELLSLNFSSL